MPEHDGHLKTVVLLCGNAPQATTLGQWLMEVVSGVAVHVVPDLCSRPHEIAKLVRASGAFRLVLALCSLEYAVGEVQAQARKAGLDALGIEAVNVSVADQNVEKMKVLLAAAVARARTFAGSTPAHAKLYVSARMSRRSLFTLSLPEYRAAPAIAESLCAADRGCHACVQVCPQTALAWSDGRIDYDKGKCEPCGLCVTACPRGAIHNPALTPAQLAAQISTLLDPVIGTTQPRGIVFTCQRAPEPERPWHEGWMPVRLLCVGMASPAWFLAPLLMGASAVGVLPCNGGCPVGQDGVIAGRVAYCRAFLQAIGAPAEMVSLSPALHHPLRGEGKRMAIERPFDHTATVDVLVKLAQEYNAPPGLAFVHSYSPLGVVEIREDVCTGCGRCAMACPTETLSFAPREDSVSLTFDAARCTACGQCLAKCPESASGAITLSRRTDLERLGQRRTPIYQTETVRCVACGAPIAPGTMMKRIEALLGSEFATTMPVLTRYCVDCRGVSAFDD